MNEKNVKKQKKRGISLIVLVTTIIVTIILTTAIILTVVNNGIIDIANKAKTDNNKATLNELINLLEANWKLEVEKSGTYISKADYINKNLAEQGYNQVMITDDGKLYTNLKDNTKDAIAAGIKIGDTVIGYSLDKNKTSYTTSGKENTAQNSRYTVVEQIPTPQTISQTAYETWKYIGISENGELLIAPDMISGASSMELSGKGGFVSGSTELNNMCEELYSSEKGTARSINIDDIHRILNYTGPKGGYTSKKDSKWYGTDEALTFGQLISQKGETAFTGESPESEKDIENYYADGYSISKTSSDISTTDTVKNFIFTSMNYWLASSCTEARLQQSYAYFGNRYVRHDVVLCRGLFSSNGDSYSQRFYVRPVICLNSNVQLIPQSDGSWKI